MKAIKNELGGTVNDVVLAVVSGALGRYLRSRGFAIYPGKLTRRPSFRIGTIGQVDEKVMREVLQAVRDALKHMGVKDLRPAD